MRVEHQISVDLFTSFLLVVQGIEFKILFQFLPSKAGIEFK